MQIPLGKGDLDARLGQRLVQCHVQVVGQRQAHQVILDEYPDVEIEVEVENETQLREALDCGIKRLLLDNQSPEQLAGLVKIARSLDAEAKLEASGNVNLDNVRQIAETGVDFISIGALTHSAPSSDFSLRFLS